MSHALAYDVPMTMTYAEFLEFERHTDERFEFVGGQPMAMERGTPEHARLAGRVIRLVGNALAERRCELFTTDLRIRSAVTGDALHPDVTVVCGELRTDPADPRAVTICRFSS